MTRMMRATIGFTGAASAAMAAHAIRWTGRADWAPVWLLIAACCLLAGLWPGKAGRRLAAVHATAAALTAAASAATIGASTSVVTLATTTCAGALACGLAAGRLPPPRPKTMIGLAWAAAWTAKGTALALGSPLDGSDFSYLWGLIHRDWLGAVWITAGLGAAILLLPGRTRPWGWSLLILMPLWTAISCGTDLIAALTPGPPWGHAWAVGKTAMWTALTAAVYTTSAAPILRN